MKLDIFNEYCENYRNMKKLYNKIYETKEDAITDLVNFIKTHNKSCMIEECFISANDFGLIILNFYNEVPLDFITMICESFNLKVVLYQYHNDKTTVNLMINL